MTAKPTLEEAERVCAEVAANFYAESRKYKGREWARGKNLLCRALGAEACLNAIRALRSPRGGR